MSRPASHSSNFPTDRRPRSRCGTIATGQAMTRMRWPGILLLFAAVVALAWLVPLWIAPYEVVSYETVRAEWRSSDAWLLDRHGEPLSRVRIDKSRRRGDWVELAQISPALVDAMLAAEDRRFRSHDGVDWLGLASAFRETSAGGRRGGSTITMPRRPRAPLRRWRCSTTQISRFFST